MREIKKHKDRMLEKIESAKAYAHDYVHYKAHGNASKASKAKAAAEEDLRRAMDEHSEAVEEIDVVKKIFRPSEEMQKAWEKAHLEFTKEYDEINRILAM